jgi:AcrR family transcriptional regulator
MRQVAAELGTGPASLYAHVANKDDLLDLIYDRAFDGVQVPEPDPERWQDQIRHVVLSMVDRLIAHNGIAIVGLANVPSGPNSLRIIEGVLRILLAAGVPRRDAGILVDRLSLLAVSDAHEASIYLAKQRSSGKDPKTFLTEYFGQIREFIQNLPVEQFPTVRGMVRELVDPDGEERFRFGLDLMLDGIAARIT